MAAREWQGRWNDTIIGSVAEHPNAAIYRKTRKLVLAGDFEGLAEQVTESIAWWEVDMSDPIVGKRALVEHLHSRPELGITSDIHDLLANDEHLVALIHAVADTPAGRIDLSFAEVIHFEDGRIAKRQVFPSDVRKAVTFFGIV